MDNMHYTLDHLLPYQRNFNFANAVRSIGKTYGSYYYFIKDWIKNKNEFCVLCRTQEEKKKGYLQKAVQKVLQNEFPQLLAATNAKGNNLLTFNADTMQFDGITVAHCIALSEAVKIKKNAYPKVKWLFLDEYAIEEDNIAARYVNGWNEPDLLLSIYHTIDREEDRVIFFGMANNISAYNPYHVHKAFRIPYTEPGNIYKSANVLFENAKPSEELVQFKSKSRFLEMIEDTEYGSMAVNGDYIYDKDGLVEDLPLDQCVPFATIIYNNCKYGVWRYKPLPKILISPKVNPTLKSRYAVTQADMTDGTILARRTAGKIQYLGNMFKFGYLRFSDMETKKRFSEIIPYIL